MSDTVRFLNVAADQMSATTFTSFDLKGALFYRYSIIQIQNVITVGSFRRLFPVNIAAKRSFFPDILSNTLVYWLFG